MHFEIDYITRQKPHWSRDKQSRQTTTLIKLTTVSLSLSRVLCLANQQLWSTHKTDGRPQTRQHISHSVFFPALCKACQITTLRPTWPVVRLIDALLRVKKTNTHTHTHRKTGSMHGHGRKMHSDTTTKPAQKCTNTISPPTGGNDTGELLGTGLARLLRSVGRLHLMCDFVTRGGQSFDHYNGSHTHTHAPARAASRGDDAFSAAGENRSNGEIDWNENAHFGL